MSKQISAYGFEDYRLVELGCTKMDDNTLSNKIWHVYNGYYFNSYYGDMCLFGKDYPLRRDTYGRISLNRDIIQEHKEVLDTANKVYVHPECGISRALVATKYKKSLNPWLSDAVIMPDIENAYIHSSNYAVFINEEIKVLFFIGIYSYEDDLVEKLKNIPENTKLDTLIDNNSPSLWRLSNCTIENIRESELLYVGSVTTAKQYIIDILNKTIPLDKLVFEKTVQETLGTEENKITYDNLISIKEMLSSTDDAVVQSSLKALSVMDYMHYPNSVKLVLAQTNTSEWIYNKAMNSTSVKFMFKQLLGEGYKRALRCIMTYNEDIYKEDYELFKQLKCFFDNIPKDCEFDAIKSMPFMSVSDTGYLTPNLK